VEDDDAAAAAGIEISTISCCWSEPDERDEGEVGRGESGLSPIEASKRKKSRSGE